MKNEYLRLMKYYIKNIFCLRNIIYIILIITGVFLTAVFLISERWMSSPQYYDQKLNDMVYRFNLGFHWTTMLGMLGVILLVFGILSLIKKEECVMASAVFTLFVIHMSTWDYLLSSSKTYIELVLELDNKIMLVYSVLFCMSVIFTIVLLAAIFVKRGNKRGNLFYRVTAVFAFLCSLGCLIFKTICNQWYLFQALLSVGIVVWLFGGRLRYRQYTKKKRREGWKVL